MAGLDNNPEETLPAATDESADGPIEEEAPLATGYMIDHFRIMRLIGRGGMGQVFLARDVQLGRRVALKLINPKLIGSGKMVERFLFEAKATARFSHPNIVTVYSVGIHKERPYVALEYLSGDTLRARLSEGIVSWQEAARIGVASADALAEAHRHGILHRDLKPANMIIGNDGRLRIVDFGLAKQVASSGPLSVPVSSVPATRLVERQSAQGLKGTPAYMAPEQWLDATCSDKTDVWALGVILFELLTGERPFTGGSLGSWAVAVCAPEPARRADSNIELPNTIVDLIASCLEKDPVDRPTALEVSEALNRMLGAPALDAAEHEHPFRGLMPFTERHSRLFFGRNAEIEAFLERMRSCPVLPVIGPSGSGKSSFVRAGVMARLREHGNWMVLRMRPGRRPFHTLASRLADNMSSETITQTVLSQQEGGAVSSAMPPSSVDLAVCLQHTPQLLSTELRKLAEFHTVKIMLVVDQLEELFTMVDDASERIAFMTAICSAADDRADPVRVVFTVRDDFLGRLVVAPQVRQALRDITVLQPPDQAALRQILRAPVEALGYSYETDALVAALVLAVRGEPAGLPLLQFAAHKLWEQRDQERKLLLRSAYDQMGGVAGALASHADGVLDSLAPGQGRVMRHLMVRMVTAERTRRIISRADAVEGLEDEAEQVLMRLVEARLVTVRRSRGEADGIEQTLVELAHESLIERWTTLARWLDESREELAMLEEAAQAAQRWDKRGRREDELWQGEGLREALRMLKRTTLGSPALIESFLAAGEKREQKLAIRRRRARRALMGMLGAFALAAASAAMVIADRGQTAREHAHEASKQRDLANRQRAAALVEGSVAALGQGDLLEARGKLRLALEIEDSEAARALWWRLQTNPLLWRSQHGMGMNAVLFSPDGKRVAASGKSGVVYLIDTMTRAVQALRGHRDQVLAAAFSPSTAQSATGTVLATGSWDGEVRLWNITTGQSLGVLQGHGDGVRGLRFSTDGRQLATGVKDGTIQLWDLGTRTAKKTWQLGRIQSLAFTPSLTVAAAGSGADNHIHLWNLATGKQIRMLKGHSARINGLCFSPDSKLIASASADKTVRLWDAETGAAKGVMVGHRAAVMRVSYSHDGQLLASTGMDKTVRIWDVVTAREHALLRGHRDAGRSVGFSPDGARVVSGGMAGEVLLWELERAQTTVSGAGQPAASKKTAGHDAGVYDVSFSPDGRVLASKGRDGTVRLWNIANGVEQRVLHGHAPNTFGLSFSPDGQLLAASGNDNSIRLYELATGQSRRPLFGHSEPVMQIRFSPDGQQLASAGTDNTVRLWNVATAVETHVLRGHTATVFSVAYDPDGKSIATGGADRTLRIWDRANGKPKHVLRGHEKTVGGLAFSPNGRLLASGAGDSTVRLWDMSVTPPAAASPAVLGRQGRVYGVAFHPEGEHVGASSSDGVARIWTLKTGQPRPLQGHRDEVNNIAFSPDGKLAATAGDDNTVRLWTTSSGRPFWNAPLLLSSRGSQSQVWLLSHRGWRALDQSAAASATKPTLGPNARKRIEHDARLASQAQGAPQLVCLLTHDDKVELWDLDADRQLAHKRLASVGQLLAFEAGCLARAKAKAYWFKANSTVVELADAGVTAVGLAKPDMLVAAGSKILRFSSKAGSSNETLQPSQRFAASQGATAIARIGKEVVGGYPDGSIEQLNSVAASASSFPFEHAPSSAVLSLLEGPLGTVIAGYANGALGVWSMRDGKRLAHARLHGPVVHLLLRQRKLYAASELGSALVWDLGDFYRDRCGLLREVWSQVPVVWHEGHAAAQPPPKQHPCAQ